MSEFELWCLSIDADGEIIGEPFVVRIASSKTIAHLKQEVWPRDPILSSRLVVWKLNGLSHDDFLKEPHSRQSLISQAKGDALKSKYYDKLSTIFPKGPQGEFIHFVIEHPSELSGGTDFENQQYLNLLTFRVGDNSQQIMWNNIPRLNKYTMNSILLNEIKDNLEKPRRMAGNISDSMARALLGRYISGDDSEHSCILNRLLSDESNASPYIEPESELVLYTHFLCSTKYGWMDDLPSTIYCFLNVCVTISKAKAYMNIFHLLVPYWINLFKGNKLESTINKPLPFFLVAEAGIEGYERSKRFKYRPRPDFVLLKDGFPFFLAWEISSKDENRLYAQLACVHRLACAFLKKASRTVGTSKAREDSNEGNNFFLMGVFFLENYLERCIVFNDQNGKICFHKRIFLMNKQSEAAAFLFEFFNYSTYIKENVNFGDVKPLLKELYENIDEKFENTLHSTNSSQSSSVSESDEHSGSKMTLGIKNALLRSDFEPVPPPIYDDEFEPLYELPDHVVKAQSTDGTYVIAKLVKKDSHEQYIHYGLSRDKSTLNHTIPLLDIIPSSLGSIIILPYETTLHEIANFDKTFPQISIRLSQELIEGVAFLHKQDIAHLDIKPFNIVYSQGLKRLYLIDFSLSKRCDDEDEMVTMSCGTKGWSAPEIELDRDKPRRAFSPIRADLWSCGKVLRFMSERSGKIHRSISMIIDKLMDDEPWRRPLLRWIVDDKADFWDSCRLVEGAREQLAREQHLHFLRNNR